MSDATSSTTDQDLFSRDELKQFEADDVVAGSAIGKMLTAFFCYTVLAMSIAAWWTFRDTAKRADQATNSAPAPAAHH